MVKNSAINLYASLGVHIEYVKVPRNLHHTKKGPGRKHQHGKDWTK